MHASRFDTLTRSLSEAASRRRLLGGVLATVGLGALLPDGAAAKKRRNRRNRRRQPKKNAFGCLNVGKPCRGKDRKCCSGLCQGKKPQKGKRDKSKCVAHNVGNCTSDRDLCVTANVATSNCNPANPLAVCRTTTGNAPFCANANPGSTGPPTACQPCRRDQDCLAFGYPAGSACLTHAETFCPGSCSETGGTACMHPGA